MDLISIGFKNDLNQNGSNHQKPMIGTVFLASNVTVILQ